MKRLMLVTLLILFVVPFAAHAQDDGDTVVIDGDEYVVTEGPFGNDVAYNCSRWHTIDLALNGRGEVSGNRFLRLMTTPIIVLLDVSDDWDFFDLDDPFHGTQLEVHSMGIYEWVGAKMLELELALGEDDPSDLMPSALDLAGLLGEGASEVCGRHPAFETP